MKKRLFLNKKDLFELDKGVIVKKKINSTMTAEIDYGYTLRYVLTKIAVTVRKDGKAKVFLITPLVAISLSNKDACAMLAHDMNEWLKKENEA